jgi:hypothetical protein
MCFGRTLWKIFGPSIESDAQLLSAVINDSQSAAMEMATLNVEDILANNPILADIIGNPQINLEAAMALLVEDIERTVSNTNLSGPIAENVQLDMEILAEDLEEQLNKPIPLLEEEGEQEAQLINIISNPFNQSQNSNNNSNNNRLIGTGFRSSPQSQSQSQSQFNQRAFDLYLEQFLENEQNTWSARSLAINAFLSRSASQSQSQSQNRLEFGELQVLEIDFNYVDEYLTQMANNRAEKDVYSQETQLVQGSGNDQSQLFVFTFP